MLAITDPDKLQARRQWSANPCGTGDHLAGLEPESLAWFDAIRRHRYEVADPWMPRTIPFAAARGQRLLEIGHGIGTDLLTFAEAGAEVHGVDLTPEHHRLATRNFELHGEKAVLELADAAALPFPAAPSTGCTRTASSTIPPTPCAASPRPGGC